MYEYRCDERLQVKGEGSTRPRIHWVVWGTGTPKDRDEVNRPTFDLICEENTTVTTLRKWKSPLGGCVN
jgi:hypothetical protein